MWNRDPTIPLRFSALLLPVLALTLLGLHPETPADGHASGIETDDARPAAIRYQADLRPLRGSGVTGTVTFSAAEGLSGLQVHLTAEGLDPGHHAQYIHMNAGCPNHGPVLTALRPFPRSSGTGTINYQNLGMEPPTDLADRTVVVRSVDGVPVACGAIEAVTI